MKKLTSTQRLASSGQFINSNQSIKTELATFRTVVSGLKKDPAKLRAVAIKAGISTPTGKLKKAYAG